MLINVGVNQSLRVVPVPAPCKLVILSRSGKQYYYCQHYHHYCEFRVLSPSSQINLSMQCAALVTFSITKCFFLRRSSSPLWTNYSSFLNIVLLLLLGSASPPRKNIFKILTIPWKIKQHLQCGLVVYGIVIVFITIKSIIIIMYKYYD